MDKSFFELITKEPDKAFTYVQIKDKFNETLSQKFKAMEHGSAILQFYGA